MHGAQPTRQEAKSWRCFHPVFTQHIVKTVDSGNTGKAEFCWGSDTPDQYKDTISTCRATLVAENLFTVTDMTQPIGRIGELTHQPREANVALPPHLHQLESGANYSEEQHTYRPASQTSYLGKDMKRAERWQG